MRIKYLTFTVYHREKFSSLTNEISDKIRVAYTLDCASAIENVLIPKLIELNITIEELRQKTLYQLNSDSQLTFRVFCVNKNTVMNNLQAASFTDEYYCMHIPLDNFEYTTEKNYAEIAIGSNKILQGSAKFLGHFTYNTVKAQRIRTAVFCV